MKLGFKKEYWLWLLIYVLANIVGAIIMINKGFMIGDVDGFRLMDVNVLLFALVVEVVFYFLIMKTLFSFLFRIKMPQILPDQSSDKSDHILGIIVFILQLLYILFNIINGINVAGMRSRSDSIWNFFWIFTPIDMVFLVYYGLNRDDRFFNKNLGIYIVSNLLRGWSGIFLYIMFFEWCRAYRNNKLKLSRILGVIGIGIALYPLLLSLKWLVRVSAGDITNLSGFSDIIMQNADSDYYFQMLETGMNHLVGRLQHTSVIAEIINGRTYLQEEYLKGAILPFWGDGLPQLAYRKALGIDAPFNLGIVLTQFFFPDNMNEVGSWNVSVGYSGWFYVAPLLIPVYLLYTILLCALSVFCIKQISARAKDGAADVIWLAWLSFLMQGWMMAFIGFIYSILLFILFKIIAEQLARITFKSKSENELSTTTSTLNNTPW